MLVKKLFNPSDVLTIKLSSGEEIIAKFVSENDRDVVVVKPLTMTLMQVPGQPGQGAVAFVPFMLGIAEDSEISLNRANIVAIAHAQKAAASGYIRNTTGIEMPQPDALSGLDLSKLKL
jgi:hypothetical protein